MPRRAGDLHFAAEEQRALMHAEEAERLLTVQIAVGDADAVVDHFQADAILVHRELHVDARGARMPRYVGEDLLEDAEHRRRHVDVELHLRGQLGAAADAGALLELKLDIDVSTTM